MTFHSVYQGNKYIYHKMLEGVFYFLYIYLELEVCWAYMDSVMLEVWGPGKCGTMRQNAIEIKKPRAPKEEQSSLLAFVQIRITCFDSIIIINCSKSFKLLENDKFYHLINNLAVIFPNFVIFFCSSMCVFVVYSSLKFCCSNMCYYNN